MKAIYATLQEINGQYQYLSTSEVNDIPSSIINEYNKYISKYRNNPLPNIVKLTDYVFIESEYNSTDKTIKGYYICNEQFTLLTIDELITKSNTIITRLFKKYDKPKNDTQMDYYFNIIKKIIMTNHISFITKEHPINSKEVSTDPIEMWVCTDETHNYIEYYEGDIDFDHLDNYELFELNKDKIIEILNSDDYNKNKVNDICKLLRVREKYRKYLLEKGNNGSVRRMQRFLKKIEKYITISGQK